MANGVREGRQALAADESDRLLFVFLEGFRFEGLRFRVKGSGFKV